MSSTLSVALTQSLSLSARFCIPFLLFVTSTLVSDFARSVALCIFCSPGGRAGEITNVFLKLAPQWQHVNTLKVTKHERHDSDFLSPEDKVVQARDLQDTILHHYCTCTGFKKGTSSTTAFYYKMLTPECWNIGDAKSLKIHSKTQFQKTHISNHSNMSALALANPD